MRKGYEWLQVASCIRVASDCCLEIDFLNFILFLEDESLDLTGLSGVRFCDASSKGFAPKFQTRIPIKPHLNLRAERVERRHHVWRRASWSLGLQLHLEYQNGALVKKKKMREKSATRT